MELRHTHGYGMAHTLIWNGNLFHCFRGIPMNSRKEECKQGCCHQGSPPRIPNICRASRRSRRNSLRLATPATCTDRHHGTHNNARHTHRFTDLQESSKQSPTVCKTHLLGPSTNPLNAKPTGSPSPSCQHCYGKCMLCVLSVCTCV